jgi:hypothetical protein
VFAARPPASSQRHDLRLVRAVRRTFAGPAGFLADPGNRARVSEYLADMARPYGCEVPAAQFGEPPSPALGQSYGEMAEALIGPAVAADGPVDLLVLAFGVHDLRPGRQTAAYLSHLTPGAPMAFAICDQGSAAAFSALRIAREYASSAGTRRALLIVAEQAALPYQCQAPVPSQHQAVAMLYSTVPVPLDFASAGPLDAASASPLDTAPAGPLDAAPEAAGEAGLALRGDTGSAVPDADCAVPHAQVAGFRQHGGVAPGEVAGLAAADLAELSAGRTGTVLVLSGALAALWTSPAAGRVRAMPPGQPSTGVWWGLIDEMTARAGRPDLVVAADYDPGLHYLCLTAFA